MDSCPAPVDASIRRRGARRPRPPRAPSHRRLARPERWVPRVAHRVRFIGWAPQQNRSQVAVADKCETEPATHRPRSDTATVGVRGARRNPGFRKRARRAGWCNALLPVACLAMHRLGLTLRPLEIVRAVEMRPLSAGRLPSTWASSCQFAQLPPAGSWSAVPQRIKHRSCTCCTPASHPTVLGPPTRPRLPNDPGPC